MSTPGFSFSPPAAPTGLGGGKVTLTSGAPTATPVGTVGWAYDPSNGNAYYWNGSAWAVAASGGGGDAQRFFINAGDPNGVVTASVVPALVWDKTNNTFWNKEAGAGTNTGWVT